tara:strand:- start:4187 stop:5431 length:1245 start_codon:yes stop_codon:yes gene_type:complete
MIDRYNETMESEFLPLIKSTMANNQRKSGGHFYTVPSDRAYPYQWLWDSCWHALIYSYYQPELAEKEIETLLTKQWENGMVPHVIYWERDHDVYPVDWGVDTNTTTLIQPPVIAYTALRIFEKTSNTDWLQRIFPKLVKWHEYLARERQLPNRNIYGIINPDESGEDNSPRFDIALDLPPIHDVEENQKKRFALFDVHKQNAFKANQGTHEHFWVEDVPFNIFTLESVRSLSRIAEILGDQTKSDQLLQQADQTAEDLRRYCFSDGVFLSAMGPSQPLIEVDTWAHFAPLFAGLYSPEEASELIDKYFNSPRHFSTPFSIPTVSQSDEAYAPTEPDFGQPWQHPHWRGPIWMVVNWCVYQGLKRYGFNEEAAKLKTSTEELIRKSGMREYYHPETGQGMGADRFTWAGLILDMN